MWSIILETRCSKYCLELGLGYSGSFLAPVLLEHVGACWSRYPNFCWWIFDTIPIIAAIFCRSRELLLSFAASATIKTSVKKPILKDLILCPKLFFGTCCWKHIVGGASPLGASNGSQKHSPHTSIADDELETIRGGANPAAMSFCHSDPLTIPKQRYLVSILDAFGLLNHFLAGYT